MVKENNSFKKDSATKIIAIGYMCQTSSVNFKVIAIEQNV